MSEPFVSEIRIFAGNFAPRGWAFCDGQLLPISSNTALFSLIGTIYGGDGRNTFGLPDMQGRAPMEPGRGPGLTARRIGERIGTETVTLAPMQMPNHRHDVRASVEPGLTATPSTTTALATSTGGFGTPIYAPVSTNMSSMASETLGMAGGSQSHDNMQPYLVMNFIIALVGLYPSRG